MHFFAFFRRKNPGTGGNRKSLEVSLSESSRKFISCIRKYMLLYLNLLEKTRDLVTLEKAYTYLRTDKRVCLVTSLLHILNWIVPFLFCRSFLEMNINYSLSLSRACARAHIHTH